MQYLWTYKKEVHPYWGAWKKKRNPTRVHLLIWHHLFAIKAFICSWNLHWRNMKGKKSALFYWEGFRITVPSHVCEWLTLPGIFINKLKMDAEGMGWGRVSMRWGRVCMGWGIHIVYLTRSEPVILGRCHLWCAISPQTFIWKRGTTMSICVKYNLLCMCFCVPFGLPLLSFYLPFFKKLCFMTVLACHSSRCTYRAVVVDSQSSHPTLAVWHTILPPQACIT